MQEKYGSHIKDIVYGANDGIITTFAIVAGVIGGGLSHTAILILGFASLLADGFSMAGSNYLAIKSEHDMILKSHGCNVGSGCQHKPLKSALITFVSFISIGSMPLMPYLFSGSVSLSVVLIMTFLTLFIVGSLRTFFTGKNFMISGLEMLLVGGLASLIAYYVGLAVKNFLGQ